MSNKKKQQLANFEVKVTDVICYHSFYGKKLHTMVSMQLSGQRTSKDVEVEYGKLDSFDFESIDHSFLLNAENSKAHSLIIYDIKKQIAEIESKDIVLLDKLGWYRDDDRICYNAGDCVITSGDNCYEPNKELADKYRLEMDPDCDERNAIKSALEVMNIDYKNSSVIFTASLLGILRQLMLEAQVKPPCAVYIVGTTQNRKSTLATLCSRIYNRSELMVDASTQMARVSSSIPMLEQMMESYKDCVFILDDLFRDPDNRMRKEYERRIRGILRNYADNSARKNVRNQYSINAQLFISAEYLLDSITDLGRCFIVHIDKPVPSNRLTKAQENPLALSTFYYYFIKHVCRHYDEIVEFIREEFKRGRSESYTHIGHYERVYETANLLITMFKIICNYAIEHRVITEKVRNEMLRQFREVVDDCMHLHSEIMSTKKAADNEMNLALMLMYLLDNGYIPKGARSSQCFIKGRNLYITNAAIIKAARDVYRQNLSAKRISGYFAARGISSGYSGGKNPRNVKKYDGRNYLVLDCERLREEAMATPDTINGIL